MKSWQKVTVSLGAIALIGAGVWTGVARARKGVVTVQTASVIRQDLTQVVTASGEIKPRTYTNVMAEGFGKITDLAVKEGDRVKRGAILLRLENIQPSADVEAQ